MLGVSTLKYEYTPDGKKKKKISKEKNAFMLQVHFRLVKFDVWFIDDKCVHKIGLVS